MNGLVPSGTKPSPKSILIKFPWGLTALAIAQEMLKKLNPKMILEIAQQNESLFPEASEC